MAGAAKVKYITKFLALCTYNSTRAYLRENLMNFKLRKGIKANGKRRKNLKPRHYKPVYNQQGSLKFVFGHTCSHNNNVQYTPTAHSYTFLL